MAAGLGFKTFVSGEVLTAADTNGYLMQGVLVFASASARNAAITSPQEGQYCYLKDTNSTEYYDGAAWVSGVEGDISGVTAGTGISGGGTSGTVTVTNSMATAITTKGDLVPGTGSGTFSRLAVGNNGETLVADSSAATGLRYQGNYAAGKNNCLNGAMQISQRGTSFTIAASGYALDRYSYVVATAVPTGTITQQTFTPGTAPVAGYEGSNFLRVNTTANNGCTVLEIEQKIEDVRVFAGQTVSFSYWAKADAASTLGATNFTQNFGSGGSGSVTTAITMSSTTLGTGWVRYTGTVAVPSISGKTIGTSSYIRVYIQLPLSAGVLRNGTYDFWGWQLEAGNTATNFQTATGNLALELAACQRYYVRFLGNAAFSQVSGVFPAFSTTVAYIGTALPVTMRVIPTAIESGTVSISNGTTRIALSSLTLAGAGSTQYFAQATATVTAGLVAGMPYFLQENAGGTAAFLAFSAEF